MKKCFVIGLITALIPMANSVAAQKTIDLLMAEKQAKIKKLEACKGTTKNLKIAGISTLGVTAVGVGANIAEAVVLNDYDNKVKKEQKELLKQQDLNKKLKADQEAAKQAAIAAANQPQNIIYDSSNDVVDTCDDAKKLLISKKAISEDDSCVCGGTGITCGDKDFNFKEIKENAPKIDDSTSGTDEISTSGISVESCDAAKAFLIKNKMIESNTSCECDIEDAITCGTETFYFEKIGNKKEEKLQTEPVKPKQPVKTTENININRTIDYSSIDTEISNSISIKNPKAQCSGNAQYTGNNVWKHICTNITFNITISGINCGDNKQWNKSSGQCTNLAKKTKTCKDGYKYDTVKKLCVEKTPEQNLIQMRLDFDAAQSSPNCPGGVCYDQNIKVCQSPKYLYDNDCVSNQDILNKYCVGQGARQTSYGALICEIDFSKERYSSGQDGLNRAKTWASHIPNITCDNPIINTIGDDVINCHVGQVTFKFIFDALNAKSNEPGLGESLQKGMEAKSQRMGAFGF